MERLDEILKELRDHLQQTEHEHCSGVHIFISGNGYSVKRELNTPGSLSRSGIAMRNLRGEWIKATPNHKEAGNG